ncbi:uncharacterized protein LOC128232116 isoform X2 [Mya arenaria]|uniref:uncharacterized protein LOC128232116 isoform X2 n=1 Tax=Mya arenaria TaxID=6604 RepID=UPI0022E2A3C3|nr:uncharacterized protein LOC128232116 isoform X2 [Mya arenaria]
MQEFLNRPKDLTGGVVYSVCIRTSCQVNSVGYCYSAVPDVHGLSPTACTLFLLGLLCLFASSLHISIIRLLEDLKHKCYCDLNQVIENEKDKHVLQEERCDAKQVYFSTLAKKLYLQYLAHDKSTWPSVQEGEQELKQVENEVRAVKKTLSEENDKVYNILESATEDYTKLKEKVSQLEEKLQVYQKKKSQFEARHHLDPSLASAAIEKCEQAIARLGTELANLQAHSKQLGTSLAKNQDKLISVSRDGRLARDKQQIKRLAEIVQFLEKASRFRVLDVGEDRIQLELLDSAQHSHLPQGGEVNLQITLVFDTSIKDRTVLADIKINVDHFNLGDIIDFEVAKTDIPYLLLTIQDHWVRCFPLLAEIDLLNKTHAIDWIQEESKLRVLVGNCGKAMITLNVPSGYPSTRGITLTDNSCLELEDTPGDNATLLDWVEFLERKFENMDS